MVIIENYFNTQKMIETIKLRIDAIEFSADTFIKEKENLIKLEDKLKKIINQMDKHLKQLHGIENKLYYEMAVNGLNPNKAVEKISMYNDVSVSAIWKNYYPQVKNKLQELKD